MSEAIVYKSLEALPNRDVDQEESWTKAYSYEQN